MKLITNITGNPGVVFYNDIKALNFEPPFNEKWRELEFDNLSPCTEYQFSIETIYKLPGVDGKEGDTKRSSAKSIVAETLCVLDDTETVDHSGQEDVDYSVPDDEAIPDDAISTTTPPPIQPISEVITEQTVQVCATIIMAYQTHIISFRTTNYLNNM